MSRKSSEETPSPRPTLASVADAAGVSVATVSAVLNDRSDCWASAATRRRVLEVSRRLGYRPNLAARSLRQGRTHTLGLITTALNIGNPHNRLNGMDAAAARDGYALLMSFHLNDPAMEDRLIRAHLDRGVDGIAIYAVDQGRHEELRKLTQRDFPVVTFDGAGRLDFDCEDVSPDYEAVGALQARHLIERGCRRVCIARTRPSARINDMRETGAARALVEAGWPPPLFMEIPISVDTEVASAEQKYRPAREWIRRNKGAFDGVIAYDSVASVVIRGLLEEGISVPHEVAVIGSGNSMLAEFGVVPITSIDVSESDIGAKAFSLLKDRVSAGSPFAEPPGRILISPRLIVRQSTWG